MYDLIEEIIIRVPEYLFPVASVCFSNTTKMVADDCRLQNMVGLICKSTHQAKLAMAKRPSMEACKISEAGR